MTTHRPRTLAVILHADVVGSTALVQRDETLAHARIQDALNRFSQTIAGTLARRRYAKPKGERAGNTCR